MLNYNELRQSCFYRNLVETHMHHNKGNRHIGSLFLIRCFASERTKFMDDLEQILTPKEVEKYYDTLVEAEMIEAQLEDNKTNKSERKF